MSPSKSTRLASLLTDQRVQLAAPIALLVLIGLLLLVAPTTFFRTPRGEILAHALASAAGVTAMVAMHVAYKQRRVKPLTVMLWGVGLTILLELAQLFTPGRNIEFSDVFNGFAGVLLAAIVIDVLFRSARLDQVLRIQTVVTLIGSLFFASILVAGPWRVSRFIDWLGINL